MRASLGSSSTSRRSWAMRTGRKNTMARSAMPRRPETMSSTGSARLVNSPPMLLNCAPAVRDTVSRRGSPSRARMNRIMAETMAMTKKPPTSTPLHVVTRSAAATMNGVITSPRLPAERCSDMSRARSFGNVNDRMPNPTGCQNEPAAEPSETAMMRMAAFGEMPARR